MCSRVRLCVARPRLDFGFATVMSSATDVSTRPKSSQTNMQTKLRGYYLLIRLGPHDSSKALDALTRSVLASSPLPDPRTIATANR